MIVILSRKSPAEAPFFAWLPARAREMVLIAPGRLRETFTEADIADYAEVAFVDAFDDLSALEAVCARVAGESGIELIFAPSELDLLRASLLRDRFGTPGQSYASAVAFRDKIAMKRILSSARLRNPSFAVVRDAEDLARFHERAAGPVLLKLRTGAGSKGVHLVDSADSLAEAQHIVSDQPTPVNGWFAERFVLGEIYHVDGLQIEGRIVAWWASRYVSSPMRFSSGEPGGTHLIDRRRKLARDLFALAGQALEALPTPSTTTFHIDVFRDPAHRLWLGEVASRTAGNRIRDMIELQSGINLDAALLRALAGEPWGEADLRPTPLAGWAALRKRPGRVAAIPDRAPFPWMRDWRVSVRPGEELTASGSSVDNLASFLVIGDEEDEIEARLTEGVAWARDRIEIEPLTPA